MSARTFKLVGAAGAAALAIGAIGGPAVAAAGDSADVDYSCSTQLGLTPVPSAHYDIAAAPAKMTAGQKVSLSTTGTITLDAMTSGALIQNFFWAKFDAKIKTPTTATTVGQNLTVPKTAMGALGSPTVAPLSGKTILAPTKAGTYAPKLGNLGAHSGLPAGAVTLNGYDASNNLLTTAVFPDNGAFGQCLNVDGKTAIVDSMAAPVTVAVSKDGSKTTTKASYSAKKDVVSASAKVAGSKFKLAGTGKVKFTLKKGSKTVKTVSASLKKGTAKTTFKKIKAKGSYSVVAKFKGDAGLKGSSGKATFKVK